MNRNTLEWGNPPASFPLAGANARKASATAGSHGNGVVASDAALRAKETNRASP